VSRAGGEDVVQRELPVKLTDVEMLERGDQLADLVQRHERVKAEKKRVDAGFNSDLKEIEAEQAGLARAIDTGTEDRLVRCHWVEDLEHNCRRLIRQDTGEEVDVEALTPDDLQEDLALEDDEDEDDDDELAIDDEVDEIAAAQNLETV